MKSLPWGYESMRCQHRKVDHMRLEVTHVTEAGEATPLNDYMRSLCKYTAKPFAGGGRLSPSGDARPIRQTPSMPPAARRTLTSSGRCKPMDPLAIACSPESLWLARKVFFTRSVGRLLLSKLTCSATASFSPRLPALRDIWSIRRTSTATGKRF